MRLWPVGVVAVDPMIARDVEVVSAHWVDVTRLHRARPAPAGSVVVVNLGRSRDVALDDAWRVRGLVIDAALIEVIGGTELARARLVAFLDAHPDLVPGVPA